MGKNAPPLVLTVGHSTHPINDFIGMLQAHEVTCVVDVRTVPQSRRNPQFGQTALAASLQSAGIRYVPMPGLGGLRHPKKDSLNGAWQNDSFRGYANYMQTAEFARNIEELISLAIGERIAVMCAEAVPWRCHRSLIGDALLIRGVRVEDIMTAAKRQPHVRTLFAKVEGTTITYPGLLNCP